MENPNKMHIVRRDPSPALLFGIVLSLPAPFAQAAPEPAAIQYADEARQVMEHVQKTFWDPARSIYTKTSQDRTPDYVWRQASAFSALLSAAPRSATL